MGRGGRERRGGGREGETCFLPAVVAEKEDEGGEEEEEEEEEERVLGKGSFQAEERGKRRSGHAGKAVSLSLSPRKKERERRRERGGSLLFFLLLLSFFSPFLWTAAPLSLSQVSPLPIPFAKRQGCKSEGGRGSRKDPGKIQERRLHRRGCHIVRQEGDLAATCDL